ncbi:ABC transporter permease [Clostridium neonatale]|uniref:ABC transporter permease n=1 Tax=Clostridium neonatale TaxID=137838 RepID=UPI00291B8776|nr:Oligopeptide ABC transporter, permease component [Clostridium neonatale]CAI3613779.1 Oligopeptide ABC transporter, permease component [Clostridium neonatale]CAI3639634.1 Oligopeptide ABC transporter, permease component [Clostridium neonatale]CAI3645504.1 Oligopeptide ABC transporter, permease component [Clostridium neonatale]CAI3648564.1 Oligopeptide ABC transporter, permease component [Clostridium neonatale]
MSKYILKRILISIPVLIGVIFIIFIMLNVVPGDPITLMMGEHIKPDLIEQFRVRMGLDDPVIIRFFKYIINAIQGDLGMSYKLKRDVTDLIKDAFPNTVKLALFAAVIAWIVGIPAGIISAIKQNTIIDRLFMSVSLFGVSMPVFWGALLLQYVFAYKLKVFPVSGYKTWMHLALPAIVLGWSSAGTIARLTRSSLLEIMQNDFIRTARAKGASESIVVVGHALKNALLLVVTMMAIQISSLLSGAVITESIFSIPGIGRLAVDAISNRDMPLLQGTVLFTTVLIIGGNLVADILYSVIDPRIRCE